MGAHRSGVRYCVSRAWAPTGPRVAFAEILRAQGSGLNTPQAGGSPHAPENPAPPPAAGFRIDIHGLVQSPEVKLSLVVGKHDDVYYSCTIFAGD